MESDSMKKLCCSCRHSNEDKNIGLWCNITDDPVAYWDYCNIWTDDTKED